MMSRIIDGLAWGSFFASASFLVVVTLSDMRDRWRHWRRLRNHNFSSASFTYRKHVGRWVDLYPFKAPNDRAAIARLLSRPPVSQQAKP